MLAVAMLCPCTREEEACQQQQSELEVSSAGSIAVCLCVSRPDNKLKTQDQDLYRLHSLTQEAKLCHCMRRKHVSSSNLSWKQCLLNCCCFSLCDDKLVTCVSGPCRPLSVPAADR